MTLAAWGLEPGCGAGGRGRDRTEGILLIMTTGIVLRSVYRDRFVPGFSIRPLTAIVIIERIGLI